MSKVVVITGASSGMGKETALQLLNEGYTVYGLARRLEKMKDIQNKGGYILKVDVTKAEDIDEAVSTIIKKHGRIDILINNAGFSVYGPVETVTFEDAKRQFDVNFFGTTNLTKAVIPFMREARSGHIINVTSVAGKIHFPLGSYYHASKHALEGWSDCLRVELKQFGINVTILEPGAINTEFGDVMNQPMLNRTNGTAYEAMGKRIIKSNEDLYDDAPSGKPKVIADAISKEIKRKSPRTRIAAGKMAKTTLSIRRILSDRMFDNFVLGRLK